MNSSTSSTWRAMATSAASISRARSSVSMRATCLRECASRFMLSSCPVTCWKRRFVASSFASSSMPSSSTSLSPVSELGSGHDYTAWWRVTKRARTGSFWMARSIASRATTGSA